MSAPTRVVPDPAAAPTRPSGMALDEVTLVARAREGDVHTFEQLVRRYQGPMFGLARRMLGSRSDAEVEFDRVEAAGSTGLPERAAETGEQMTASADALARLPPTQWACCLFKEVHGRSYEEIAQATGTTNATVRGRIARARAQVMEVMAPW